MAERSRRPSREDDEPARHRRSRTDLAGYRTSDDQWDGLCEGADGLIRDRCEVGVAVRMTVRRG